MYTTPSWLAAEANTGMNPAIAVLVLFILVVVSVITYIIPIWVATYRQHKTIAGIVAFDLLLGWTFIGWALALTWALPKPSTKHRLTRPQPAPAPTGTVKQWRVQ
jgi:uncharacterized membrane protein